MSRNTEVIRQWTVLRELEAARQGLSVRRLAEKTGVSKRTMWRDLQALQEAGFPLYTEEVNGETRYRFDSRPVRALPDKGFTLTQLCALYFSRTLVQCLAGTPFHAELKSAFDIFERALAPAMKTFLDRLPAVLAAKPAPAKRRDEAGHREIIASLLDASLHTRRVSMRYHSLSSGRTKDYLIEPYRIAYADGGLYLFAYVPEYREVRTFAVERIKRLVVLEEHFEQVRDLGPEAFPHSIGAGSGEPQRIELEFSARVAPYVGERQWHRSQKMREQPDGSLRLTLEVCVDWALRSWILGFGPFVRVVSPAALAEEIYEELDEARTQYAPRMEFEAPMAIFDPGQRGLPFRAS